jgi:hypothetical protein
VTLTEFYKLAFMGACSYCMRTTWVARFKHPLHPTHEVHYCFICSKVSPMCTTGDQRLFLAAVGEVLDALKPPKKPRQPKVEGPHVHPMRPRRAK